MLTFDQDVVVAELRNRDVLHFEVPGLTLEMRLMHLAMTARLTAL